MTPNDLSNSGSEEATQACLAPRLVGLMQSSQRRVYHRGAGLTVPFGLRCPRTGFAPQQGPRATCPILMGHEIEAAAGFRAGSGVAPPALTGREPEQAVLHRCLANLRDHSVPPHDLLELSPLNSEPPSTCMAWMLGHSYASSMNVLAGGRGGVRDHLRVLSPLRGDGPLAETSTAALAPSPPPAAGAAHCSPR